MRRLLVLLQLLATAAAAQTTTAVTLQFSGIEQSVTVGSATGTLAPFGAATLGITATPTGPQTGDIVLTFTFPNKDTLIAGGSIVIGQTTVNGTAAVTGGTGTFAKATGSINFTVNVDVDTDPNPFTVTGSGTVVIAASGVILNAACAGAGGATCSAILCSDGVGSALPVVPQSGKIAPRAASPADATCSTVTFDVAGVQGGSTLPVLVFEGGGSTSPVLTFLACCGGSTGTLPVLVFEGGGSSLPVLAWCNGCGTLPVRSEHPNTSVAAPPGSPVEIALPLQAAATTYNATAQCPGTPATCWLAVPVASGSIAAASRTAVTAYANPQGQAPGVYTGSVTVTIKPSTTLTVPVTMLVTGAQPAIQLSQTGVRFQALAGAAVLSQSITVANTGADSLNFAATTSANWLSASPASGIATASTPATIKIQANPAGLAPGTYYGRVDFKPASPANSTQSIEVALVVLAQAAAPDSTVSPTGLIFTAAGSQTVQVANPAGRAVTVTTSVAVANGSGWLTAKVAGSTVTATAAPAGLNPGTYVGTLAVHIAETNTDHSVAVVLVVPKSGACTPTQLLPVITNLEGGFQVTAGFPVPLQALVVDNCGATLNAGSVMAYFPRSSDPSVSLMPLGQGQWSGTWMPHSVVSGPAAAGIMASGGASTLFGSTGVIGGVTASPTAPLSFAGGVVNAASLTPPLSPGTFFSIFGANLAASLASAGSFPYPTTLSDSQVLLGGELLPLEVAANGQINAAVPYDAVLNSLQQLIVQRNGGFSMPETVLVAPAGPAVFTLDQSGKGPGAIVVIKPDGTQFVNGPSKPASAGDYLVIYATGLGAVNPPVAAGAAASGTMLSHTPDPVVMIGGKPAQIGFSGLTPGFASLYQINVIVPGGIAARPDVTLTVSVQGATSPPVTVAIQ